MMSATIAYLLGVLVQVPPGEAVYMVLTPLVTVGGLGFAALTITHIVVVARWTARLQTIQEADHEEIKALRDVKHDHDGRIIKLESADEATLYRLSHIEDNIAHLEERNP